MTTNKLIKEKLNRKPYPRSLRGVDSSVNTQLSPIVTVQPQPVAVIPQTQIRPEIRPPTINRPSRFVSLQPAISPEDRYNGRVRAPRQTVSPDVARERAAAKLEAARQMNPGLSDYEALDRYNDRMDDYNS